MGIFNIFKNIFRHACDYLIIQKAGYQPVTVLKTRVINFVCTGASRDKENRKTSKSLSSGVKRRALLLCQHEEDLEYGNIRLPGLGNNVSEHRYLVKVQTRQVLGMSLAHNGGV